MEQPRHINQGTDSACQVLPLDIWIHVLSHAGSKAICHAACVCKRLRDAAKQLATYKIFASAGSIQSSIVAAVQDAAKRALEGMLGAVDFAVLYSNSYDESFDHVEPTGTGPALMLQKLLPQGVPVVGCCCEYVSNMISAGNFKVETIEGMATVVVLLGHMPGCEVRPLIYWTDMYVWSTIEAMQDDTETSEGMQEDEETNEEQQKLDNAIDAMPGIQETPEGSEAIAETSGESQEVEETTEEIEEVAQLQYWTAPAVEVCSIRGMVASWLRSTTSGAAALLQPQAAWLMYDRCFDVDVDEIAQVFGPNTPVTGGGARGLTFALGRYMNMIPDVMPFRSSYEVGCAGFAFCPPAATSNVNTHINEIFVKSRMASNPAHVSCLGATAQCVPVALQQQLETATQTSRSEVTRPVSTSNIKSCAAILYGFAPAQARDGWNAPVLFGPHIDGVCVDDHGYISISGGRYTSCSACGKQRDVSSSQQGFDCFQGYCTMAGKEHLPGSSPGQAIAVWRDDCVPGQPNNIFTRDIMQSENRVFIPGDASKFNFGATDSDRNELAMLKVYVDSYQLEFIRKKLSKIISYEACTISCSSAQPTLTALMS